MKKKVEAFFYSFSLPLSFGSVALMSIAIPRCTTLTDVIQRASGTEVAFPTNPAMWKSLLQAIPTTPGSQQPPLYVLEDSRTGESFVANQLFVRDFIERWSDDETHTVTVNFQGGLRTFRASTQFWDHVVAFGKLREHELPSKSTSGLFAATAAQAQLYSVTSSLEVGFNVQVTADTWNELVEMWNRVNQPRGKQWIFGATQTPLNQARRRKVQVAEDLSEEMNLDAKSRLDETDDIDVETRPRSGAIIDPETAFDERDFDILYQQLAAKTHKGATGPRYWTHFMRQWRLLEAQYRNYV